MKKTHTLFSFLALQILFCAAATAQTTQFVYQGVLRSSGQPANGSYDLQFQLFDEPTTGSQVGYSTTNTATGVTNGLFDVLLDFGAGPFDGQPRWLQISVRTNGNGDFTPLSSRQQIASSPYSIQALNAASALTAASVPAANIVGTVASSQLPATVLTNDASNVTLNNIIIGGTNNVAPLTIPPTLPPAPTGMVTVASSPQAVAVVGRYLFAASLSGSLQIVDVSVPSQPAVIGTLGLNAQLIALAVAGRYAYVGNASGAGNTNNLIIVDTYNPSSPAVVGALGGVGYVRGVAVAGHYAYLALAASNALAAVDVSNPTSPVVVDLQPGLPQPVGVTVAGNIAYVTTAGDNQLHLIDVSNPSSLSLLGSVGVGATPEAVSVSGRYAYVAGYAGGTLQTIDISQPLNPYVVGSVSGLTLPAGLAVAGRYAYVAGINSGISAIDISNPTNPVVVGFTPGGPEDIAVSGRYAYVVGYANSGPVAEVFDLGGAYIQQFEAGSIETGSLQTRDTATVGNNLNVRGGLTVSGSARITGGLSVNNLNGTIPQSLLGPAQSYTPTIGDGTHNFTTTTASGYYANIGNLTFFQAWLVWSSKGSASGSAALDISLPSVSAALRSTYSIGYVSGATYANQLTAGSSAGQNFIQLFSSFNTGSVSIVTVSGMSSSGEIQISGFYRNQ